MLYLYTSEYEASKNKDIKYIVTDVEAQFSVMYNSIKLKESFYDEDSTMILKNIEGMTSREKNTDIILAKYGNTVLSSISTGAKGALLALNSKSAIYTDEMGVNVINCLGEIARTRDINLISSCGIDDFDIEDCRTFINGIEYPASELAYRLDEVLGLFKYE